MTKMKTKILSILLISVMVIGITGCGSTTQENKSEKESSKTNSGNNFSSDMTISCLSPYGDENTTETYDTIIEKNIVTKYIITEVVTNDNEDEYKKQCEDYKNMENPYWAYYENDKVECNDSTYVITHTKTYIKDENLSDVYNIKMYTNDDGTFDSKGYVEYLESYKYSCTIK
jgi:predicted transcriptional regulator